MLNNEYKVYNGVQVEVNFGAFNCKVYKYEYFTTLIYIIILMIYILVTKKQKQKCISIQLRIDQLFKRNRKK